MNWNPLSSLFSNSGGDHDRGQVGIGTLIVFISMVLVAAIAAGVLVDTAGMLQQSAQQAGEESADVLTQRLDVTTVTGKMESNSLNQVSLTVQRSAGADTINLEDVSIQIIAGGTNDVLTHGDGFIIRNTAGSTVSGSSALIDEQTDRRVIEIGSSLDSLTPGDTATLKVTTASGATTHIEVTVPDPATDGFHEL